MKILVANAGSTSLKYRLYQFPDEALLAEGRVENIGAERSSIQYRMGREQPQSESCSGLTYSQAIRRIIAALTDSRFGVLQSLDDLDAVGFKVVHAFQVSGCVLLTNEVLEAMKEYQPVAPLHNRVYLDAIRLFREEMPATPLIGLFETDFHRTIPPKAFHYAVPRRWLEKYGVRRYGFHGASFRYLAGRVPQLVGKPAKDLKIVACHLGGSSSVCAIRDGKSLETTMGFSPQSGLPQSARAGELDVFALLYLLRKGENLAAIEKELVKESGLKGLSGFSGDVPVLEQAAAEGNETARLALEVFVHEVRKKIGAYTAVLGGVDVLVFSGGIGERGAAIRASVCEGFDYLGLHLDIEKNTGVQGETCISREDSRVDIWVVPTNEEVVVAREAFSLLAD